MTLTAVEIDEGWIAKPCGCAYCPGDNTTRDIGGGMAVVASGFRMRWCEEHIAEMKRERDEMRYRLFEAPDTPTPSPLDLWRMRNP